MTFSRKPELDLERHAALAFHAANGRGWTIAEREEYRSAKREAERAAAFRAAAQRQARANKKKRQTRRSVSLAGLTYQRLVGHCAREDVSVSGFLERLIAAELDHLDVPRETVLQSGRTYPREGTPISGVVTL